MLTNEIYKGWSGMKASEYKAYKGIRKESLRDNMTIMQVNGQLDRQRRSRKSQDFSVRSLEPKRMQ